MRASTALCLLLMAFPVAAQWKGWDYENDRPVEQFKEDEIKLPAFPDSANLVQFEASPASAHRFYIDSKALSVGADGIVRYTLLMKTRGGATNVSYEGMSCDPAQVKVYATGSAGGKWIRARNPRWMKIERRSFDIHHIVLFTDFFCALKTDKSPDARVEEALELLRNGPRETYRD